MDAKPDRFHRVMSACVRVYAMEVNGREQTKKLPVTPYALCRPLSAVFSELSKKYHTSRLLLLLHRSHTRPCTIDVSPQGSLPLRFYLPLFPGVIPSYGQDSLSIRKARRNDNDQPPPRLNSPPEQKVPYMTLNCFLSSTAHLAPGRQPHAIPLSLFFSVEMGRRGQAHAVPGVMGGDWWWWWWWWWLSGSGRGGGMERSSKRPAGVTRTPSPASL